jgi:phosphatidylglycerol:prolipoprotein diacylglycerol transferase
LRRTRHPDGFILWWYLLLSGVVRFLVEFVRINPPIAWGLTEAQLISLALIVIASVQIWRNAASEPVAAAVAAESARPPAT